MVLDVLEPCFILVLDVIRPLYLGAFRGATMPDVIGIYFNFNSGDLASTSSQIYGSWILPMFQLRDGSLTLM